MDGLFDLLFFALIAWLVLRAVSRASQAGKEERRNGEGLPDGEAEAWGEVPSRAESRPGIETARGPAVDTRAAGKAPGGVGPSYAPSARRLSPVEEIRRRLLAEAQRWEAERRRLEAGDQTQRPDTPPWLGGSRPPEPELPSVPPTTAESLPAGARTSTVTQGAERTQVAVREVLSERVSSGRAGHTGIEESSPVATDRPAHGVRFPEFRGRSPQQRAILYAEILGPPKGV